MQRSCPLILALALLVSVHVGCGDTPSGGAPDAARIDRTDAATPDARPPRTDAGDPGAVPRSEATACRFRVPDTLPFAEGTEYDCGDLIVFEDRDAAAGYTIKVHYIRFKGASTNRATIYLDGGPGGNGENIIGYLASLDIALFNSFLAQGDFLVISQRGTSLSVPSLSCQGAGDCGADLSLIADLPSYNTGYNADDVDDLRAVLGYDSLNLYGISYGSRLALEVLRRHGDKVRAAVIDGNVPAQINWPAQVPSSFYSALTGLTASCTAVAGCDTAFGNLETKFVAALDALNADPVMWDYQGDTMWLDGDTFASVLFINLYSKWSYPWLPMVISDMAQRRTDRVGDFLGSTLVNLSGPSGIATGMYYSVVCGELFNPPDETAFDTANAALPAKIRAAFSYNWPRMLDTCAAWPKGTPRPTLIEAVTSAVPTFVGSGTMDPITPPTFGALAASTLSDKVVAVFQNSGHGATLQTECGRQSFTDFLADPSTAPDLSCADTITTTYILPGAARATPIDHKRLGFALRNAPVPPPVREQARKGRKTVLR